MNKIEEAQEILKAFGLPTAQQNEMSALTLLALCNIKENDSWAKTNRQSLGVTKGIMSFVAENYGRPYAPNTQETFRRQVLHQFVQGRIADYNPDEPDLPVNSPKAHYAISNEALSVIKTYNTGKWKSAVKTFISQVGTLTQTYEKERSKELIPVTLEGKEIKLSAGKHNEVQAAVIEQFAPRFAGGATVLYLGDTANKDLHIDKKGLEKIGIPITEHSKLPDVVIYDE
ncbi:MAG: restriction endonuclease, partial [Tannerella sp.]|nr:restriction endonuclease [Tannerella sp.]